MEIPQTLYAALLAADEDYLIALCNKGTVNRAKKDRSAVQIEITQIEGEAVTLTVGDTVCTITAPLGSSTCTCPSSSMCRHRISAILWLKDQAAQESAPPEEAAAPSGAEPPEESGEELAVLLSAYPTQGLTRQLGERRVSALVQRESAGEGAAIREGGTVTVKLPWNSATVRFISPLEHSSCTCHSRSFCVHKAEALLSWQLRHGVVTADNLLSAVRNDADNALDRQEICATVQAALADWMRAGLTRLPASSQETAERLAGLCHISGLPALERAMRRLHGELKSYFVRSAAFRAEGLLRRMSAVWRLAAALQTASEQEALRLAGTFRDEYQPVGSLHLYLLGLQDVRLAGGYAGTVYYFWETQQHRYYAYRDLRPVFYEGRRQPGPMEALLWGLPGTLRQSWNCRLNLTGARVSGEGNLSATTQCQGTLLQKSPPGLVLPPSAVEEDFSALLPRSRPGLGELKRLAILRPQSGEQQEYDQVEQKFTLRLLDGAGRDVWLTVRYREGMQAVLEVLEQLADQWEQTPDLRPVFFGVLYREGGRLCLYPIECFTNWEGTP